MIINDDNGIINVVGDTPWKHTDEPEPVVEGKGFRLLEVTYVANEYECLPGRLARVRAGDAVFTSAFGRLFYGFSDFLTMMLIDQMHNAIEAEADDLN